MRIVLAATMMLLLAPAVRGEGAPAPVVAPDVPDDRYVHELNSLLPSQVQARRTDGPPTRETKRIPIRGHVHADGLSYRVTILVPLKDGHPMHQFYVEHSPYEDESHNKYFGPFKLP